MIARNTDLTSNYKARLREQFRAFEAAVLEAAHILDGLTSDEIIALVQYLDANTGEVATDRVEFVLSLLEAHRSIERDYLIL